MGISGALQCWQFNTKKHFFEIPYCWQPCQPRLETARREPSRRLHTGDRSFGHPPRWNLRFAPECVCSSRTSRVRLDLGLANLG